MPSQDPPDVAASPDAQVQVDIAAGGDGSTRSQARLSLGFAGAAARPLEPDPNSMPSFLALSRSNSGLGSKVASDFPALPAWHKPEDRNTSLSKLGSCDGSERDALMRCESTRDTAKARAPLRKRFRNCGLWLRTQALSTSAVVKGSPVVTLLIPILLFATFVTVGEVAVWAAASSYTQDREESSINVASSTAAQLDNLLRSMTAPVQAAHDIVALTPYVPDLAKAANKWISILLSELDPANHTVMFNIIPWNVKVVHWPWSPALVSVMGPNADFNMNPVWKPDVLRGALQPGDHYYDLLGPLPASAFTCELRSFCVRLTLWLPTANSSETWGNDVPFTVPWMKAPNGTLVPLGNNTVNPKYRKAAWGNNTSAFDNRPLPDGAQLVYWGAIMHCVCITAMRDPLDNLLDSGQATKYKSVLFRYTGDSQSTSLHVENISSSNSIVYESNSTLPRATDVKNACHAVGANTVLNLSWVLCISPIDGYEASWKTPMQVVVAVLSLLMALMAFLVILYQEKHELLVHAMLPAQVVKRLKLGKAYAEPFTNVTILFADIVSYTNLSSELTPSEVAGMLNGLYSGFDDLVDKHKLYKVGTIGDAFMCVGGAPEGCHPRDAAERVARLAFDMIRFTETFEVHNQQRIQIRIGINTGDVTAAVVGKRVPLWILVGDTVNVSSRMESSSKPMHIHVGATTAMLLENDPEFVLEPQGVTDIKGKGPMTTFWLRQPPPNPKQLILRTAARVGECFP